MEHYNFYMKIIYEIIGVSAYIFGTIFLYASLHFFMQGSYVDFAMFLPFNFLFLYWMYVRLHKKKG